MKKILVIGSLNMDIVINVQDVPVAGETVIGSNMKYVPGGKGANQAYAAGKLGTCVKMLGCVGNDNFGDILLNNLNQARVDTSHMVKSQTERTGVAVIYVNSRGNNCIVVTPGANGQCDEEYIRSKDSLLQEADYILLQMEIPQSSVYFAIHRAYELGKTILLNPAPAPRSISDDILRKLDYITPNETELAKITGRKCETIAEITEAAETLVQRGVKNVIVTMGERGALLACKNGAEVFPTYHVENVADTTAAGDCFNAAFVVALAEGSSHPEAMMFANAASSIVVTRQGAQSSIPTREEVLDFRSPEQI